MTDRLRARLDSDTIAAAPGEHTTARVVVANDGSTDATVNIRSLGLDGGPTVALTPDDPAAQRISSPALSVQVPAGEEVVCDLPVLVPATVVAGQHAVGVEVRPDAGRPIMLDAVVSVASVRRVELDVTPSPIRGRRRAKFHLDLVNNEPNSVRFDVDAEGTDVAVEFEQSTFLLQPAERATTRAKVKGPRLWRGEPLQHTLLVTARSAASSTTTTAPFVQQPVFVRGARVLLAAASVIALFVAGILGYLWWQADRDEQNAAEDRAGAEVVGIDTDGDGRPDMFYDRDGNRVGTPTGIDTDGDGVIDAYEDAQGNLVPTVTAVDQDGDGTADFFVDANGAGVEDPTARTDGAVPDEIASSVAPGDVGSGSAGGGGDGVPGGGSGGSGDAGGGEGGSDTPPQPMTGEVRGKVNAPGDVDLTGLSVSLVELGADTAPPSTEAGIVKYWPIRTTAASRRGGNVAARSELVAPSIKTPDVDGNWKFQQVALRKSYELTISGQGFNTESLLVTPPEDGSTLSLEIDLTPGVGALRGRVVGAGGAPLGGATITLSDGQSVVTTTADTLGDPGSFRLDQLGTPGVYTMTTEFDGYGTDVRQFALGPGEEANGISIALDRGVATVTGRIRSTTGESLGGATVSASNGSDQRTTSSFTRGDPGVFSLPQLTIGTTYTVSVELDGYGTQTRRIPVNGNISGVVIDLAPTASTLSGTVRDGGGELLGEAGVIVKSGALEFRTSTSSNPPGEFTVPDLPAGSYTVTVEHFLHEPATQIVEVVEGRSPDPMRFDLVSTGEVSRLERGTLVVEVIDPGAPGDEPDVSGATVIVSNRAGVEVVRAGPQEPNSFTFDDLPVGTYDIRVTVPNYDDGRGRATIGPGGREEEQISVLLRGSVSGIVIDSVTKQPIVGQFQFAVRPVIGGLARDAAEVVTGGTDNPSPGDGERQLGEWETTPRQLGQGEYQLQPTANPTGYEIREDQLLDPDASGVMRVLVTDGREDRPPIIVEADPFPSVRGRVLAPRLAGTVTQLAPIDAPSLEAWLRCANGDGTLRAELQGAVFDRAGAQDDTNPLYDQFEFDFRAISSTPGLLGDGCRVDVAADGFLAGSVAVPGLGVSNGVSSADRVANLVLRADEGSFGGQIFWTDPRTALPVPLDDVAISGNAIVDFNQTDQTAGLPGDDPEPVFGSLSTESDGGAWALDGQVFGSARFDIRADGFEPTFVDVSINQDNEREVVAPDPVTVTPPSGTRVPIASNTSYDLQLDEPIDGEVLGQVQILTTATTPDFDAVGIQAYDPQNDPDGGGTPIDAARVLRDNGSFRVDDATAGTWDVVFTPPDNHILHVPSGDALRAQDVVDPAENQSGFDTTLVDLATVEVELVDRTLTAPDDKIGVPATITLTPTGASGVEQRKTNEAQADGVHLFERVAVDVDDPTTEFVQYRLTIDVPSYDPQSGRIEVPPGATATNGVSTLISVRAGVDVKVRVSLEPFGSAIGQVLGRINGAEDPLDIALGEANIEVRVHRSDPFVTVPFDDLQPAPQAQIRPFPDPDPSGPPLSKGQFRVVAPPDTYRFRITHPAYTAVESGPITIVNGSETDSGSYTLDVQLVALRINATQDDRTTPLTDFEYVLRRENIVVRPDPTLPPPLGSNGGVPVVGGTTTVTGLSPGTYRVEVRSWDSATTPKQDRFPFIADIDIRFADQTTTTVLDVSLPLATTKITGQVEARNSADQLIPLPDARAIRTYEPQAGLLDAEVTDDDGSDEEAILPERGAEFTETLEIGTGPNAGKTSQQLTFQELLALGVHEIRFTGAPDDDSPPGYTVPASRSVTLSSAADATIPGGPMVFTVSDVTTRVRITASGGSGSFAGIRAWLVPTAIPVADIEGEVPAELGADCGPSPNQCNLVAREGSVVAGSATGSEATFQFTMVPPGVEYHLVIVDALYQPGQFDSGGALTFPAPTGGAWQTVSVPVNTGDDLTVPVPETPPTRNLTAGRGLLELTVTLPGGGAPPAGTVVTENGNTLVGSGGVYEKFYTPAQGNTSVAVALVIDAGLQYARISDSVTITAGNVTRLQYTLEQRAVVSVAVRPIPPPGTVVQLESSGGSNSPPTTQSDDNASGTRTYEFSVPTGQLYRVSASGQGPTRFFPSDGSYTSVGTQANWQLDLQRIIEVIVPNATANTTVTIPNGNASAVQPDESSVGTYVFRFDPWKNANSEPFGTGSFDVLIADSSTGSNGAPLFQSVQRTVTGVLYERIEQRLRSAITVKGSLTTSGGAPIAADTPIRAVETDATFTPKQGGRVVVGTVAADKTFQIPGLLPDAQGLFLYRIELGTDGGGVSGVGTAVANVPAGPIVDESGVDVIRFAQPIAVQPRTRNIEVRLVGAGDTTISASGAGVTLTPGSGTPPSATVNADGIAVFADVRETLEFTVGVTTTPSELAAPSTAVTIGRSVTPRLVSTSNPVNVQLERRSFSLGLTTAGVTGASAQLCTGDGELDPPPGNSQGDPTDTACTAVGSAKPITSTTPAVFDASDLTPGSTFHFRVTQSEPEVDPAPVGRIAVTVAADGTWTSSVNTVSLAPLVTTPLALSLTPD